ncbi:MAG TPA: bifunctional protein-serine/threonine kinase/phosphatase [Sulfuricurvum sp.]|nr:bifunctional protein-serine/threonine kinase/phosphatase [Sulfuricurvum sp.]
MLQVQSSEFILPKPKRDGDDACAFSIIDNTLLVSVLCDGVGSARRGGTAARQCVKFFIDQFKTRPKAWTVPKTMEVFTRHINNLLFTESMTQYERIELLTTLCIAVIEGDTLYTLNLGDSRIYLLTIEGQLKQLTTDHTMDDEHMSHVLTQACGLSENVELTILSTPVNVGDTLILCSDGVYNLINTNAFTQLLQKGLGAKSIIQHIVQDAKEEDRDDMSLQIFRIEALDPLHAIKNIQLPIPQTLKQGEVIDGYILMTPMMEHERIWKVSKNNKIFVMKFPMRADDEQALDEFVREAWYAKQINHKAFGNAWVPDDRSMRYYMMELIEGVNLREYLINRPLSIDNAIALGIFLHDAEAHLLQLGLVHGDIKPENIIVTKKGGEAGVDFKMVDFGSIVEIFSLNSRAGTPSYLAPERFTGGVINESTEIFSIGVTLYWALTSTLPYGEIEPFQTPTFKNAKRPVKLNSNIPAWLDSIIMHAIAIDPDERYHHYSELFHELKSPDQVNPFFTKGIPLIERSPLTFYKTGFLLLLLTQAITLIVLLSK